MARPIYYIGGDGMVYTASYGETWDSVSYKAYGDEMAAFPEVLRANPGLEDIVTFKGGEKIIIPEKLVIENKIISSPFQTGATIQIINSPW